MFLKCIEIIKNHLHIEKRLQIASDCKLAVMDFLKSCFPTILQEMSTPNNYYAKKSIFFVSYLILFIESHFTVLTFVVSHIHVNTFNVTIQI